MHNGHFQRFVYVPFVVDTNFFPADYKVIHFIEFDGLTITSMIIVP